MAASNHPLLNCGTPTLELLQATRFFMRGCLTITRRKWSLIVVMMAIVSSLSPGRAAWEFTSDRLVDDFDSEPFPGWSPSGTTPDLLFGGSYLGPASQFDLFLMDFLNDLQGETRTVDLSFDLAPTTSFPLSGPLVVSFNGESVVTMLVSPFPARYRAVISSSDIPFSSADMSISITSSSASFGLDNMALDWSVPEPSSLNLVLLLTFAAIVHHLPCNKRRV